MNTNKVVDVVTVIGACYGDEGKGALTDNLCSGNGEVCVRFNGGANAGHTIVVNGMKYYTHLLPSGIVFEDIKHNILGNGVVIHLPSMMDEINDLKKKGIVDIEKRLFISSDAFVTLDIHCIIDMINNKSIGTTCKGVGPTYGDKVLRRGIKIDDLVKLSEQQIIDKIKIIYQAHHNNLVNYNNSLPLNENKIDIYSLLDKDIKFIFSIIEYIKPMVCNIIDTMADHFKNKRNIIVEGANATMLDINKGTYPMVTSSDCTVGGILSGGGMNFSQLRKSNFEIVGVVKAYITRVGGGLLPTEQDNEIGEKIQQIGGEIGVTTGRKRRCGWFDIPQLIYAHKVNGFTCLNLTKCDVLSFLDTIKVGIKYVDKNTKQEFKHYPTSELELSNVEVIYDELPGWKGIDISNCKTYDELPQNLKNYVKYIEKHVDVGIKYINVGPNRHQILTRY